MNTEALSGTGPLSWRLFAQSLAVNIGDSRHPLYDDAKADDIVEISV